ncbi:MAG: MmgE/PrpD family protein [Deltaproteobacteria bacterium]|nr:MmgE/PrpD family protein [Deltaproteobacteria bacterium]
MGRKRGLESLHVEPLANRIAGFVQRVHSRGVPRAVREIAKEHLLDGFATMLGGTPEEASRKIRAHVEAVGGRGEARVIGTALKVPCQMAALANGVQGHVLDYDDAQLTTAPGRPSGQQVHPTTPVLAAALALAEKTRASGSELLAAYAAGVEVACRLGDAVEPGHYMDGFHPTGTLGVFGAAAACSYLLGLDRERSGWALGIAGGLSSGLRANRGTMAKALNAGRAAENGVVAATLAARGFTASAGVFEDPMGFFSAACGGRYDRELLRLGSPWFLQKPGIAIKRYPCAGVMHPMLDALLPLIEQHQVRPAAVDRLRIRLHPDATRPLVYERPEIGLQGKFSLPYTAAAALLDRGITLAHYTDGRVRDAAVRALMPRVELVEDPGLNPPGGQGAAATVELVLADGLRYYEAAPGDPGRRTDRRALEEKFQQCAEHARVGKGSSLRKFVDRLWTLERVDSLASWLRSLRP